MNHVARLLNEVVATALRRRKGAWFPSGACYADTAASLQHEAAVARKTKHVRGAGHEV